MILKLYVDILNRELMEGSTSVSAARLPEMFREDTVKLQVTLMEPSDSVVAPFTLVDITDLDLKVGIGDQTELVALQDTWTKDTASTAMTYTAELTLNTTELNAIFTGDSTLTSITRKFEIEVEDSSKFHTVYSTDVSISQDTVKNTSVDPTSVPQNSEFANSWMSVTADSETVTRVRTGNEVKNHINGLESLTSLSGESGKVAAVKSSEDGFELVANAAGSLGADDLTDVDTTTAAPSTGQVLKWDGTNWTPAADTNTGATSMDALTDADTTTAAPSTGDHLKWDGTNWVPDSSPTAHGITTHSDVDTTTAAPSTGEMLGWDGSAWVPTGAHGVKQNLTATAAPTTGDDTGDGYAVGSLWIDVTNDSAYLCVDASAAAAIWRETTVASGDLDGIQSLNAISSPNQSFANDTNVTLASANSIHTLGWTGTLAHDRGGLNADVSGYEGQVKISGGTTSEVKCNYAGTTAPTSGDDSDDGYAVSSLWIDTTNDKAHVCVDSTSGSAVWKDLTEAVTSLAFKTIDVNETDNGFTWGSADVVADDAHDTLKLVAGTNITLESDASGDAVRITAAGGGGSGTVTSVTAGDGMTQSGTNTVNPTLDVVGTTDRISVAADAIDIASGYVGQTSITTLGTVATGTWQGTAVDGAYVDIEGTEVKSTGESGGTKYLREDGDGTCSWQTVSGGGASAWTSLSDTPSSFTAGKHIKVNAGGTALEFTDAPTAGIDVKEHWLY